MEYLLGKPVSDQIREELKEKISHKKRKPVLCILLNRDDESSLGYVNNLVKTGGKLNIEVKVIIINSLQEYLYNINYVNNAKDVDACLITRPLVKGVKENEVVPLLDYKKDVDSINHQSLGLILTGNEKFVPNTALAIIKMLDYYHIDLESKKVLVIGRSLSVGKPVALLLINRHATVTIAHSKTKDLDNELKDYDIVIAAIGKPHYIDSNKMKPGSVAIDAGIHYLETGIVGDIIPSDNVSYITKVPGGIGPITVSCLLNNVVTCYEENTNDF